MTLLVILQLSTLLKSVELIFITQVNLSNLTFFYLLIFSLTQMCCVSGSNGAEETHVFSSSGENVHLPCNNALSDCTSTTWTYSRHSETVELIAGGKKKKDIERLSVGSDCSLNIKKVTKEDYGSYSCRQYVNGQQQGTDTRVHLHLLHGQCFCESHV